MKRTKAYREAKETVFEYYTEHTVNYARRIINSYIENCIELLKRRLTEEQRVTCNRKLNGYIDGWNEAEASVN